MNFGGKKSSATALVPTPLGLASYFSGKWYGGTPTCSCYQVTSLWCSLCSLALLTCIAVNGCSAIRRLIHTKHPSELINSTSVYSHMISEHASTSERSQRLQEAQPEIQQLRITDEDILQQIPPVSIQTTNDTSLDFSKTPPASCSENGLTLNGNRIVLDRTGDYYTSFSPSHINSEPQYKDAYSSIDQQCIQIDDTEGYCDDPFLYHQTSSPSAPTAYDIEDKNTPENGGSSNKRHFTCVPFTLLHSKDTIALFLFFLCSMTLVLVSLPLIGYGPKPQVSNHMCSSWIVVTPKATKERSFYVLFLLYVYINVAIGGIAGSCVYIQVKRLMKTERNRHTRLYHEENVPSIHQFARLDDVKRHYKLTCLVLAGLATWLPILITLTLQKSGVHVSEATLLYSHLATSLPGLLNPLLYSLILARYRAGYKAIVNKYCCCRTRHYKHQPLREQACFDTSVASEVHTETIQSGDDISSLHGQGNPFSAEDIDNGSEDETDDDVDESLCESDVNTQRRGVRWIDSDKERSSSSERTPLYHHGVPQQQQQQQLTPPQPMLRQQPCLLKSSLRQTDSPSTSCDFQFSAEDQDQPWQGKLAFSMNEETGV